MILALLPSVEPRCLKFIPRRLSTQEAQETCERAWGETEVPDIVSPDCPVGRLALRGTA